MNAPIRPVLVCDISGVLLNWDPSRVVEPALGAATTPFLRWVQLTGWHRRHDLGGSMSEGARRMAAEMPVFAAAAQAWAEEFLDMYVGPEPGAAELFDLTEGRARVLVLSNAPRGLWPELEARFPFLGRAAGAQLSGDVGIAKPDPAAYALAKARFDIREPALLLDDREDNCAAARDAGLEAIVVRPNLEACLDAVSAWLDAHSERRSS